MSSSYEEDWERRKTYLIRSLFQNKPLLSPIPEGEESRLAASSGQSISPLPPLTVERAPNRHDHPKAYYDELERKMEKVYRSLFFGDKDAEAEELIEYYTGDHSLIIEQFEMLTKATDSQVAFTPCADSDSLIVDNVVKHIPVPTLYANIPSRTVSSKSDSSSDTLSSVESEDAVLMTAEVEVHRAPINFPKDQPIRRQSMSSIEMEDAVYATKKIVARKIIVHADCERTVTAGSENLMLEREQVSSLRVLSNRETYQESTRQYNETIVKKNEIQKAPYDREEPLIISLSTGSKETAVTPDTPCQAIFPEITCTELNDAITVNVEVHEDEQKEQRSQSPILGFSRVVSRNNLNLDLNAEIFDQSSSESHKLSDSTKSYSRSEDEESDGSHKARQSIEVMRRQITASPSVWSLQGDHFHRNSDILSIDAYLRKSVSFDLNFLNESINHPKRLRSIYSEDSGDFQDSLTTSTPKILHLTHRDETEISPRSRKRAPEFSVANEIISKRRKYENIAVQTSFSSEDETTSWDMLKNNFFFGIPKMYNICSCKGHKCSYN